MNNNKTFYLPYNSLYSYIVQRNHVEWERYKPANEYHDAPIRSKCYVKSSIYQFLVQLIYLLRKNLNLPEFADKFKYVINEDIYCI